MSPTSKVAGASLVPKGGEHISRLVETRRGKKIFLQSKNFLLMRYNIYMIITWTKSGSVEELNVI